MIEKALKGNKGYWAWMLFLLAIMGVGGMCYVQQFNYGLGITGRSRDVIFPSSPSWLVLPPVV